jgi:hypothetical protein
MVSIYTDADYLAVYKQKKKIFAIFLAVTAVYLAVCIAFWIYFMSLPYEHENQMIPKMCVYVISAVYMIFAFPYLGIKYSRCRRYYKMLTYVSVGLKNEEKNHFYCFEEKTLQKDNIDVVSCVFETWNKKKQEWMDREAYCDCEKELPPFESGDYVRYIVQSNFVIQYEILEKKALEFEEVDDEEEFEEVDEAVEELEAVALSEKDEGVQNAELAEVAEAEGTAE